MAFDYQDSHQAGTHQPLIIIMLMGIKGSNWKTNKNFIMAAYEDNVGELYKPQTSKL